VTTCRTLLQREIPLRLGLRGTLQLDIRPALEAHVSEYSILLLDQVERRVKLGDLRARSA
jgi:hypothetical protein